MTPTIGRIVLYTLAAIDAQLIENERRPITRQVATSVGNDVAAGDVFPAIVVRVFPGSQVVNLQVLLDGNDAHWVTLVAEGLTGGQGSWHWPPRA